MQIKSIFATHTNHEHCTLKLQFHLITHLRFYSTVTWKSSRLLFPRTRPWLNTLTSTTHTVSWRTIQISSWWTLPDTSPFIISGGWLQCFIAWATTTAWCYVAYNNIQSLEYTKVNNRFSYGSLGICITWIRFIAYYSELTEHQCAWMRLFST